MCVGVCFERDNGGKMQQVINIFKKNTDSDSGSQTCWHPFGDTPSPVLIDHKSSSDSAFKVLVTMFKDVIHV